MGNSQIFQSNNPSRWKKFVWSIRIVIVLIAIALFVLVYSLFSYNKVNLPIFTSQKTIYQKLTNAQLKKSLNKLDYENAYAELEKIRTSSRADFYKSQFEKANTTKSYYPVRAGFYVNWDPQSLYSLRNNIREMNMVLPEWMFVSDTSNQVTLDIDSAALNIIRKEKVAIVPMLSNFFNGRFNGDNVHRVILSDSNRKTMIESILQAIHKYKFQGINIDFEDLTAETTDEYLIRFQKELFEALQKENLLVTQDVAPFNNDYNLKELARYNNLIFLMGYDEHNETSEPGTIAAQAWMVDALEYLRKSVPPQNVVLCIPAYGYDWPQGFEGVDMTYQDAVNSAVQQVSKLVFDPNNNNLSYSYVDDNKLPHTVFFTDAVSDFNFMRTAADFGTSGVAIWRLGSEDSRIWNFYKNSLDIDTLKKLHFNPAILEHFKSAFNVEYQGQGEVLEVSEVPKDGSTSLQFDTVNYVYTGQTYVQLPECYLIKRTGIGAKQVALTFDDGPDEEYTPEILAILKKKKVKATFFITGINAENHIPLVRKIYDSGCEIGNHTLTHPNLEKISDDRIKVELRSTQLLIQSITGHSTILFRPPYNTDSEPRDPEEIRPLAVAQNEGYLTIGSSIDPTDWAEGTRSDSIVQRVIDQQNLGNIILMHDAGGKREETVKALPLVIDYFQKKGYSFVTVSQLMGKSRDDIMPPVNQTRRYTLLADSAIFETTYLYQHIVASLFFLALILTIGRILAVGILAWLQKTKEESNPGGMVTDHKVSVIVPGYNEEVTILKTIDNLLKSDYPDFEIIVVDDGSKDKTFALVQSTYRNHPKVKAYTKPNGGKASALNFGINRAKGYYLVCIDADTVLLPDAISQLIRGFSDENVAAVAGNVQVGNTNNLLTNWQSIEYTSSQNFDRRAFDYLNSIMVIPGAIGAFRKDILQIVGGFTTDTLAEDCDLTLRILRAGYRVRSCNDAISRTEAPETVKMFLKQRFRWTFGIMQSFWKHHDLLFVSRNKNMSWVILPNILIFQLILPLLSPLVDILFVLALFSKNPQPVVIAYLVYFLVDIIISTMAFKFDRQKFTPKKIIYFFLQRIIYRQFYFYVLIKAYLKAMKGELISWGFLKRTGNVVNQAA